MSEIKDTATGTFTVVSNGAAAVNIELGFVPNSVELTNQTTGVTKLFLSAAIVAGGDLAPLTPSSAGSAVNYDSGNGGSEGGTINSSLTSSGFTVKAALADFNAATNDVVRYVARK